MRDKVYYSKEDATLADWVLRTADTLNQGIPTVLWALKVMYWYAEFWATVRYYRIKYPNLTTQEVVNRVAYKVRNGSLFIGQIPT